MTPLQLAIDEWPALDWVTEFDDPGPADPVLSAQIGCYEIGVYQRTLGWELKIHGAHGGRVEYVSADGFTLGNHDKALRQVLKTGRAQVAKHLERALSLCQAPTIEPYTGDLP